MYIFAPSEQGSDFNDPVPVCLMHSRDPKKNVSGFWDEFVAITTGTSPYLLDKETYDFTGFVFPIANFREATFTKPVLFSSCMFQSDVDLTNATFERKCRFFRSSFSGAVQASGVTFKEDVDFGLAQVRLFANFRFASFEARAIFIRAQFNDSVAFDYARFCADAIFNAVRFSSHVTFDETEFGRTPDQEEGGDSIANFSYVHFAQASSVLFRKINKINRQQFRVRFSACDVEHLRFEDVNWYRDRGRLVLQDEVEIRTHAADPNIHKWGVREYELAAVTYRRLTSNFERSRDYDLAEDCTIGEMEMVRRDPARAWAHRCLLTVYGCLSGYGSNYGRAFVWLIGLISLFALLLPFFGLTLSEAPSKTFYWSSGDVRDALKTAAAGWWASVGVATFQKNAAVQPATRWAQYIAYVETVVIPSQLALFLLALRRRFRR